MPTDAFEVIGGRRLQGEITPQGAKNEALQILCAILLSPEPITVSNIPIIQGVKRLFSLSKPRLHQYLNFISFYLSL